MRGRRQAYPNLVRRSNRPQPVWKTLDGGWLCRLLCRGPLVDTLILATFVGEVCNCEVSWVAVIGWTLAVSPERYTKMYSPLFDCWLSRGGG